MTHGGNVWMGAKPDEWLDFSANLRPEGAPDWAREAMSRAIGETRYYPDVEMRRAKAGLAFYAGVKEECILPLSGGIAAIDAVCRMGRGRRVVIPDATFGEYARMAYVCGREVVGEAEALLRPGDTVFLCNPNNPTGAAREKAAVLELFEKARSAGAELVVDEAFIDYCPEISVRREACETRGLIVVGSLTKILCVPGARLGYMAADAETIRRYEDANAPWGLNAFAAAIARELPDHLNEMRDYARINAQRRGRFARALAALGAKVYPLRANFLLVEFKNPVSGLIDALREKGILVRDCASFGLSDAHLRLAVRTDEDNARLVDALKGRFT